MKVGETKTAVVQRARALQGAPIAAATAMLSCASIVIPLATAPAAAVAQQPAPNLVAASRQRFASVRQRIIDASPGLGDGLDQCWLDRLRSAVADLDQLRVELRRVSAAATAGAPVPGYGPADASDLQALNRDIETTLRFSRLTLEDCEEYERTRIGGGGGAPQPSPAPSTPQDAPAGATTGAPAPVGSVGSPSPARPDPPLEGREPVLDEVGENPTGPVLSTPPEPAPQSAPPEQPGPPAQINEDLFRPGEQTYGFDDSEGAATFNAARRLLEDMEAARRRGDCAALGDQARSVRQRLERFLTPSPSGTPALERAAADRRRELAQSLLAELDEAATDPCPPQTESARPQIGISGGFGRADVPVGGIGFVERNGEERPAGNSPGSVDYVSVGGFLAFMIGRTPVMIGGQYGEGSGTRAFDVEPGVRSGQVYARESEGGSTGISAVEGYGGSARTEASDASVRAAVAVSGPNIVPVFELSWVSRTPSGWGSESQFPQRTTPIPSGLWSGTFWTEYRHSERDYALEAGAAGTTAGGFDFEFSQSRLIEVREEYVSAGFTGALSTMLGDGVLATAGASAGLYYRNSRLDFSERNTANFGPPADRDFAIEIRDQDDAVGFRGDLGAGVAISAGPGITVSIGGSATWFSSVAGPDVPISGDDVLAGVEAGLRRTDRWIYRGAIGITFAIPNPR